jgi:phosphatidylserine/phosphatidylglycerophosphate/cardiolipin synthase-like enzyme
VISPICPRNQFIKSLESAAKSIYIYAETFDNDEILNLLTKKAKSGVDVKIAL